MVKKVSIVLCLFLLHFVIFGANFEKKAFERILTNIYKGATQNVESVITKVLQNVKKDKYKHILLFLRAYSSYTRFLYTDAQKVCEKVLSENSSHRECLWLLFRIHINRGDIERSKEIVNGISTQVKSASEENILPLTHLLLLINTAFLYESYRYEEFVNEGKKVFKIFIQDKKYRKLNIFEIEELASILFNLYERTGDVKYLRLVLYFEGEEENEGESLSEKNAADLVEYLLYKNKYNINAYLICANIAYEYGHITVLQECLQNARKINENRPEIQFFIVLLNFRRELFLNHLVLVSRIKLLATQFPDFYPFQLLLAFAYLSLGDVTKAEGYAFKALKLHKGDISALSILYNIFRTKGSSVRAREILNEIIANKFKYAQFLYETGGQVEARARWPQAHKYFTRAYRLDKNNMKILKKYAINLSRMKKEKTAYKLIKKYVKMNPFDIEAMNIFKLLEKIKNDFIVIKTKNFVIKLHKRLEYEVDISIYDDTLMPFYVEEIAEKALETLTKRYGINLSTPIHLELLTDSEDLAVRTFGFPLLGVLGSCFGPFLTTLSPKARFDLSTPFNWASVLWHELAHSFHLYLSDFKVDRWFTEGLATYEESLADPRWFDVAIMRVYYIYKLGGLPKLRDLILNTALIRDQRLIFYDYGAIIQEYLHKTYGFEKIIELLKLWKSNLSAKEVFEQGLGKSIEEISNEFDKFLDSKFKDIKEYTPNVDIIRLNSLLQQLRISPNMELKKEDLELLVNYAVSLLGSDKKNAQKFAKIVLEIDKNNGPSHFVLGVVQKNLELNNKKAIESFLKAIDNGFDFSVVYRELGKTYYEEGNYAKAVEYLLKAIEKNAYYGSGDVEENPYLLLGRIYEEAKMEDKAYNIYNKYLSIGSKNYDLLINLADKYFEKNNFEKALDYYKLAIYLKLDNPMLHFKIARTYMKLKDYESALKVLDVIEKFAYVNMERVKNKKDRQAKKEMLARIYCTKAKVLNIIGHPIKADIFSRKADKLHPSLKCGTSVK